MSSPTTKTSSTTSEESTMTTPMTTTPAPPTAGRPDRASEGTAYLQEIDDVPGLSFARLLSTELRKLVDTRAGRWLLIAILLVTALSMGITLWVMREGGADLIPLLTAANIPQAVLIPILGIMTGANEWSQRTALVTFAQEPRRLRVMTAKAVAAVLLGLAVLVVTSLTAIAAHAASMSLVDGGQVEVWLGWPIVVHLVILQTIGVLMGVAFGALFLSVPFGIVAYFLVPGLLPLILMTTAWLREHAGWFDLGAAQEPLLSQDWLTTQQWGQLGTTSLLWMVLPMVAGFWRVAHREVK